MLSLPIYLRGSSYYLHTRIAKKQFKRSLCTNDKKLAIIRATRILELLVSDFGFDLDKVKKYELDMSRGIMRADGEEDHQRMMDAVNIYNNSRAQPIHQVQAPELKQVVKTGLTIKEVLEKFYLLKSHLKQATRLSYSNTIEELSKFLKNPLINNIQVSDITRFQEYLAKKGNTSRTIDNKISILRTIFNFGITQGYFFQKNPAENRQLLTNKEKDNNGYAIFEKDEIKLIYESDFLKTAKEEDPDYYWTLILGIMTGCRISEITGLKAEQFKVSDQGTNYIQIFDSKTVAGVRPVPIPEKLLEFGLADFVKDKKQVFKYNLRLGKGSGNAVGKKFKRHLEELKITRPKLVFHSLRKYVNNFLKTSKVPYEVRCQFIGHEIEDINNRIYSEDHDVDTLAEMLNSALFQLQIICGVVKTKF